MTHRPSVTERAYQLARTGRYGVLMQLRRALETEYAMAEVSAALEGKAIRQSLKRTWQAARAAQAQGEAA